MQADSNSTRQSGAKYPTACAGSPNAKTLRIVKDAFYIYSSTGDRRDYIRKELANAGDDHTILIISDQTWWSASGFFKCIHYENCSVWLFKN